MSDDHLETSVWQSQSPTTDPEWSIGISLSGGGYRATVFAVGALVALHDAGLADRIRWIASVSGGSLANAVAAARLPPHPTPVEVDELVRHVASVVTRPLGLASLRRPLRTTRDGGPVGRTFAGGIQRRWTSRPDGSQPELRDLMRDGRLHAFMSTDLAASRPVALSDRLVFSEGMMEEHQVAYRPGRLSLATAVRASATFPGLPAVRVSAQDLGVALEPSEHDLLLVDGGAWNNLGTDWIRVARYFDRNQVLPASIPKDVNLHLVVDATAPPSRPSHRFTRPPFGYDTTGIPALRTFKVSVASTVSAYRNELRSQSGPRGRAAVVDLDGWPQLIDARAALNTGRSTKRWLETARRNRSVGTLWRTVRGLPPDIVLDLLAHSHSQVHAHLTARSAVPYGVVGPSYERFEQLVPS